MVYISCTMGRKMVRINMVRKILWLEIRRKLRITKLYEKFKSSLKIFKIQVNKLFVRYKIVIL